ncbi:MAG: hypothetical protein IOD12_04975 [Silvanigrellales bacterium]|nr:hypothetical protein [Silvanigrellales bacterium]
MHSAISPRGVSLQLALAVVLVWSAKGLALATADAGSFVFWGAYLAWVALSAVGVFRLALVASHVGAFRAAGLFTVLVGAPFFFDFHAAVAREAPEKALLFAAGGFVAGATILTVLRGVALALCIRYVKRVRLIATYGVFVMVEATTLLFVPLLYFSAVPLPVPPARLWREGEAKSVPESERIETGLSVFVDPGSDDAGRRALSELAASSPDVAAQQIVASLVRGAASSGAFEGPVWRKVVVLFPETYLNLSGNAFRVLAASMRIALQPFAVENGVEILMGARFEAANVVFQGVVDTRLGRPRGGVVASKTSFVPFYEVPWAGVSVRNEGASEPFDENSDERLVLEGGTASWGVAFPDPPLRPALICYEALFPWAWPLRGDALVLTNHDIFSEPGTASALYDFTLRQLARASGTSVFLVANKGTSGIFGVPFARRVNADADFATAPRARNAFVVSTLKR